MFESGLLSGHRILVSGGGSGLGFAICAKLMRLGAHIHICGRRQSVLDEAITRLEASAGGQAMPHVVDIRDAASVDAMCDAIWTNGGLTGLVNNAAANFISPTERLSTRGFDAIANTVMHGTFYVTHAVGTRWIRAGTRGTVLSIVSTGVVNGAPFVVPSTMAKTGVCAMTKSLAIEWGKYGIRLNAIGPGLIPTEGAVARLMPGSSTDTLRALNPMKRLGTREELENLVAFLMAPGCDWMTGQILMMDGAHHQAHGSVYSPLLDVSAEDWTEISAQIRADDARDKALRSAGANGR